MQLKMPKVNPKQVLEETKSKATSIKAWELPKVDSSVAPANVWSNIGKEPWIVLSKFYMLTCLRPRPGSPREMDMGQLDISWLLVQ